METENHGLTQVAELSTFERATVSLVGLALRSIEDVEVSLPQFRLLLMLHRQGRSSSGDCARALGIGNSSVTRLASRLSASGHLRRGSDPAHKSVVTLELTDLGQSTVKHVVARRRRDLSATLAQLDPQTRQACAAALETICDTLDRQGQQDRPSRLPM